jgi:transcriptional regulator with XRE-family HTH domain
MFVNVGKTLALLRELRGKSQGKMAREAGIGKSQLSKYETGKELPKLDSLEKVLNALQVGYFDFFYTLYLVDRRAAALVRPARGPQDDELATRPAGAAAGPATATAGAPAAVSAAAAGARDSDPASAALAELATEHLFLPQLLRGRRLLSESTDEAFTKVLGDLLALYRLVFEQMLLAGGSDAPRD